MAKSRTKERRWLTIIIIFSIVLISVVLLVRFSDDLFGTTPYPGVEKIGSDHQHASFMVYLEGGNLNLSPTKYPHYSKANEYIFLENDPKIIHRFATGATLGIFFESLGMKFNSTCFILPEPLDGKTDYCESGDKTLKFYVNKQLNFEYEKYVIKQKDKILISYGNETEDIIDRQHGTLKRLPYIMGFG